MSEIAHLNRYNRSMCGNVGGVLVGTVQELRDHPRPCKACLAKMESWNLNNQRRKSWPSRGPRR